MSISSGPHRMAPIEAYLPMRARVAAALKRGPLKITEVRTERGARAVEINGVGTYVFTSGSAKDKAASILRELS